MKKNNSNCQTKYFFRTFVVSFIFIVIFAWLFSGWPRIWQNPPAPLNKYLTGPFPPMIQETLAVATYYATTTNSTWTVPSGVGEITIYAWGAGGGGGGNDNGNNGGGDGGGGGFASTTVSVTAGTAITIKVGGGGTGGVGTGSTDAGGGGGGYSSASTTVTNYIIGGGGGGGGAGSDSNDESGGDGGAGGGNSGQAGTNGADDCTGSTVCYGYGGGAGTDSAGGSGGNGPTGTGCAGTDGDQWKGGRGGGDWELCGTTGAGQPGIPGGAIGGGTPHGGGGGGGGYYGGGGGEAGRAEGGGGGGGGSSYISGPGAMTQGNYITPGNSTDSIRSTYCSNTGAGGAGGADGGKPGKTGERGCVVIAYNRNPSFNGGTEPYESADPVDYGATVTFSATAGDGDNDPWYLAICDSSGVTANSGAAPACNGTSYCVSSSAVASSTQNTCQWTANTVGTINWQGYAVDATTTPNIATTSPANTTNSPLKVKGTLTLANEGGSPYLYIFDGNNYQFVSDFIPGAENKVKEKEDHIDITDAYNDNGKIKLKITEEMDEIAYLDQIYLLLDGKTKINPDDGLSYISKFINGIIGWIYGLFDAEKIVNHDDGLSYLSKSDDKYLVVKKGDEYYLEFNLPKNYLNNLTKIEFIVEGYYIKISSANDEWILYKRDREADVYRSKNDPTKFQARISSAPINYWDGVQFQPVDLTIKESGGKDYKYEMSSAPYQVYFPEHLTSPIKLTNKEHSYQFSLKEMEGTSPSRNSTAQINEQKVIYPEAFENIDIEYTLRKWGIKEFFILKERPKNDEQNGATLDFVDSVDIGDLKMYLDGQPAPENFITDRSIEFVDEKTKTTIFRLPAPYAVDANDAIIQTQYKIEAKADEILIYNQTPYEWINASKRVYPIKIDASPETITAGWDVDTTDSTFNGISDTVVSVGVSNFFAVYRGGIDFNTFTIPDSATVSQVDFKFYVNSANANATLDVDEMTGGDSTDGAAKNYYDASDEAGFDSDALGASYLSGDTSPQSTGSKQVALLSQANTDLQNQLGDNWFSVGLTETGETGNTAFSIRSADYTPSGSEPQIIVTYTSGPGQITDQFAGDAATTTELFRFRLTPNYENASTTLTLDLSSITGIVSGDITSGNIYVDSNVDGRISAGETTTAFGCGSPNISGASGTITCNATSTLTMSTNYEYIYKATVSNLVANDTVTFGLSGSKIIAIGNSSLTYNSKLTVSGSTDNATHTVDASVVSISLDQDNFAYGTVPNNTASSTLTLWSGAGVTATNGDALADFYIYGANSTGSGAGWTLAGNNTGNNYIHKFCDDTESVCTSPPTNYTALTTSPVLLEDNVAIDGTVAFQLQITTPTIPTDVSTQSAVVTIQASAP